MFVPDNLTAIPKAHPDYSEELPSSSAVLATNAMNDIKANTPVTSEMLGVVIIKASRPIKKGTVLSRDNAQPDVVPSLSDLGKGFRFNNLANVDDWLSRVPKATVDISQGKTINRSETTVPSYYQGE